MDDDTKVLVGGVVFAITVFLVVYALVMMFKVQSAVKQCEDNLPRNQHCDYRIVAYVVEEE